MRGVKRITPACWGTKVHSLDPYYALPPERTSPIAAAPTAPPAHRHLSSTGNHPALQRSTADKASPTPPCMTATPTSVTPARHYGPPTTTKDRSTTGLTSFPPTHTGSWNHGGSFACSKGPGCNTKSPRRHTTRRACGREQRGVRTRGNRRGYERAIGVYERDGLGGVRKIER